MKTKFLYALLIIVTGCGFSSSLYQDILTAQEYIEKRKFNKAAEIYSSILLKKPSQNVKIKINDQLGDIYSIYLNNYTKSIEHYNNIVQDSTNPTQQVNALEKIGNIYFENLKDYKKSKKIYKKLADFFPALQKKDQYVFKYALSFFYLNEFEQATEILKKIINSKATGDSSVLAYYYLGLSKFYEGKWDEANKYWFEYLKRENRNDRIVKTKFLIANAYESAEKLKEAYNIYYSILGEYPNSEVMENRLKSLYERRVSRKR